MVRKHDYRNNSDIDDGGCLSCKICGYTAFLRDPEPDPPCFDIPQRLRDEIEEFQNQGKGTECVECGKTCYVVGLLLDESVCCACHNEKESCLYCFCRMNAEREKKVVENDRKEEKTIN